MTLSEYLNQLKERCDKATEGPWLIAEVCPDKVWYGEEGCNLVCDTFGLQADENAAIIAHARTDVPVLLEMVKYLFKETQYYDPEMIHIEESLENMIPKTKD